MGACLSAQQSAAPAPQGQHAAAGRAAVSASSAPGDYPAPLGGGRQAAGLPARREQAAAEGEPGAGRGLEPPQRRQQQCETGARAGPEGAAGEGQEGPPRQQQQGGQPRPAPQPPGAGLNGAGLCCGGVDRGCGGAHRCCGPDCPAQRGQAGGGSPAARAISLDLLSQVQQLQQHLALLSDNPCLAVAEAAEVLGPALDVSLVSVVGFAWPQQGGGSPYDSGMLVPGSCGDAPAVLIAAHGLGAPVLERSPVMRGPGWAPARLLERVALWDGGRGSASRKASVYRARWGGGEAGALPRDWQALADEAGLRSFAGLLIGPPEAPVGALLLAREDLEGFDDTDLWDPWFSAAATGLLQSMHHWQVAFTCQLLRRVDATDGPVAFISSLLQGSRAFMLRATNLPMEVRLALVDEADPTKALVFASEHRDKGAAPERPPPAAAPGPPFHSCPLPAAPDPADGLVVTSLELAHTLMESALHLRKARFVRSCTTYMQTSPTPARDVFSLAADPVASIVVVPLVAMDVAFGAMYFTLGSPSDFANLQGVLLGFVATTTRAIHKRLATCTRALWEAVSQAKRGESSRLPRPLAAGGGRHPAADPASMTAPVAGPSGAPQPQPCPHYTQPQPRQQQQQQQGLYLQAQPEQLMRLLDDNSGGARAAAAAAAAAAAQAARPQAVYPAPPEAVFAAPPTAGVLAAQAAAAAGAAAAGAAAAGEAAEWEPLLLVPLEAKLPAVPEGLVEGEPSAQSEGGGPGCAGVSGADVLGPEASDCGSTALSTVASRLATGAMMEVVRSEIMRQRRPSAPSRLQAARYETDLSLDRVIGGGGYGTVYQGTWKKITAAIKVFYARSCEREAMKDAVEMAVLNTIHHPNIVSVYACLTDMVEVAEVEGVNSNNSLTPISTSSSSGSIRLRYRRLLPDEEHEGAVCSIVAMEFCEGGTLRHAVKRGAFHRHMPSGDVGVDLPAALSVLQEVAEAVSYLHGLRLVHCDIKVDNILLKTDVTRPLGFIPKLADFGLVKILKDNYIRNRSGAGTVTHLAPEMLTAGSKITTAVDSFAFGVLMYEIYTGRRPYHGLSREAILERLSTRQLRPTFPPGTPAKYARLAARCWAQDPAARPAFDEIVAALALMQEEVEACASGAAREAAQ